MGNAKVIEEYKAGFTDPSRVTGQIEKFIAIRKMVGKKKKLRDMMKAFNDYEKVLNKN